MQMNPRPAKSLNQRPVKQLGGSVPNIPGSPEVRQTQPTQNLQPHAAPRQVTPLTKGAAMQANDGQAAFMGQKAPVESKTTSVASTDNMSPLVLFVAQMKNMVGSFAILSDDVISQNMKMALGGFLAEDRTLPYEVAEYLMSNMGFIFMGLVLDENFKNAFKESLKIELQIDKQPDNIKAATRAKMGNQKSYKSRGAMVIGTSEFLPEVKAALIKKMQDSFNQLNGFAFTHNDMFMSYVISVIEKVKALTSNA